MAGPLNVQHGPDCHTPLLQAECSSRGGQVCLQSGLHHGYVHHSQIGREVPQRLALPVRRVLPSEYERAAFDDGRSSSCVSTKTLDREQATHTRQSLKQPLAFFASGAISRADPLQLEGLTQLSGETAEHIEVELPQAKRD